MRKPAASAQADRSAPRAVGIIRRHGAICSMPSTGLGALDEPARARSLSPPASCLSRRGMGCGARGLKTARALQAVQYGSALRSSAPGAPSRAPGRAQFTSFRRSPSYRSPCRIPPLNGSLGVPKLDPSAVCVSKACTTDRSPRAPRFRELRGERVRGGDEPGWSRRRFTSATAQELQWRKRRAKNVWLRSQAPPLKGKANSRDVRFHRTRPRLWVRASPAMSRDHLASAAASFLGLRLSRRTPRRGGRGADL